MQRNSDERAEGTVKSGQVKIPENYFLLGSFQCGLMCVNGSNCKQNSVINNLRSKLRHDFKANSID